MTSDHANLQHYIRSYDQNLPPQLCRKLCALFEQRPELVQQNGGALREGLAESAWYEIDLARTGDAGLGRYLINVVSEAYTQYNHDCGLSLPISPPHKLDRWILKRYRASERERFQAHFDAIGPVSGRYLVLLWYLNDVTAGGETEFVDLGLRISARAGRLLMFPPYWMFQHRGLAPEQGDKYILSTYLMY